MLLHSAPVPYSHAKNDNRRFFSMPQSLAGRFWDDVRETTGAKCPVAKFLIPEKLVRKSLTSGGHVRNAITSEKLGLPAVYTTADAITQESVEKQ